MTVVLVASCRAAWVGDTASIGQHIAAGGAIDALDAKGQTPLLVAAGYGRSTAVSRLLQAGTSSAVCPAGTSPLHRSFAASHECAPSMANTACARVAPHRTTGSKDQQQSANGHA